MNWKLRVLVPALLIAPQAAWALGLGDIRLDSALNQPLSAEIDLVAATPEELSSLQARLASRELFQRYGIDRANYLDSLQFKVGRGKDGRDVLLVRTTTPMAEPFLTFLVEVTWGQGRLLREYTVLLDPPVFEPVEKAAPAPVAAPRTTSAAPAPAPTPPAPAPMSQPSEPSAAPQLAEGGGRPSTYRVQRNDTLSGIASRYSGGGRANTHRTMVAIYRGNPEAFGGNMNILRQGAVLRVPSPDEVGTIPASEASREIGRQTAEWRGSRAEDSGRLKLVTPSEAPGTPGTGTAPAETTGTASQDAQARLRRLQDEVEQQKRALEIKNAELANLQKELAAAAPTAAQQPAAAEPAAVEAAPKPAAAPPPVVREETPAAASSILDSLKNYWLYLLGAAALLLGGGLAVGYARRRREEEGEEAFRTFAPPAEVPVPTEAAKLRELSAVAATPAPARREGLVVEERPASPGATPPAAAAAAARADSMRLEDTLNTEAAVNLDKSDPLAEADFHMAYGLYDQAADLVQLALQREPGRRDLKLKLLEIFFVWGNKAKFLETARALQATRGDGAPGEWERIVIMGRQIAPGDPLFAGAAVSSASSGVDLNLEGGQGRVDLELLAPPAGDSIDLDLGDALGGGEATAETGENQALGLDLQATGTAAAQNTVEMPTIELPRPESPTVQTAALGAHTGDTMRERVGTGRPGAAESTAEVSMDELGIDVRELEALAAATTTTRDSTTVVRAALEAGTEEPTRIAIAPRHDADSDAGLDLSLGAEGTTVLKGLAGADGEVVDLDLGDLSPELSKLDAGLDFDVGSGKAAGDAALSSTQRIALDELPQVSEFEPVTLSEVGTKLDLARAYVDMGDPEGARSILNEVLGEGSAAQKAEAQRLLDSLPGA